MAVQTLRRVLASLVVLSALAHTTAAEQCKSIPGDPGWPSLQAWASLNKTVGGRLIATVPQASVCHVQPFNDFNQGECTALTEVYDMVQTQEGKPAEIMNPYFQNQSCSPWTPKTLPCTLGNYASYSISITSAADVVAGINFAQDNNIRLVIKNTGHDYLGRSTGKGALSLWTHNLQDYTILPNYASTGYTGPAVKLGAGIIGSQAYEIVHGAGYRVVGGECPTVGIAGGYTTGGGHSLLSSKYGMGADGVLEWEVVTPNGTHLIATPTQNTDLYWAMCGGGGGTWGVSLSMTTKIYPEGIVGGGSLTFNNVGLSNETFWNAVAGFFAFLVDYTAAGNTLTWAMTNTTFEALSITVPDQNATFVDSLFAPFLAELTAMGIQYSFSTSTAPSYYDHFAQSFGPLPYGTQPATQIFTGRLIPAAQVADPKSKSSQAIMEAFADIVASEGGIWEIGCQGQSVAKFNGTNGHAANAVLPAWREAVAFCVIITDWDRSLPYDEMLARKYFAVNTLQPALDAATPGSGVYLNEVDPLYIGDFHQNFYGANYPRLLKIKNEVDPQHTFWSRTSVGGDYYVPDADGRLCKA